MTADDVFEKWLNLNTLSSVATDEFSVKEFRNKLQEYTKSYGRLSIADQGHVSELITNHVKD